MLLDDLILPDDFYWEDEFTWNKITQEINYGTTGSLFIQESEKKTGRYITLVSSNDSTCYITRETMQTLFAKKEVLNKEMTLMLPDGRTFNVIFRHAEDPIEVVSVNNTLKIDSSTVYILRSIKLMEKNNG